MAYCSLLLTAMDRRARERTEINKTFNVEEWFLERVDAHLCNQPGGERTPQCVGDAFLRSYAEAPTRLSLSDPHVEHVSSCSYCIRSYLKSETFKDSTTHGFPLRGIVTIDCLPL